MRNHGVISLGMMSLRGLAPVLQPLEVKLKQFFISEEVPFFAVKVYFDSKN